MVSRSTSGELGGSPIDIRGRTESGTSATPLVLCGDSSLGKNRFACNIFGCAHTFAAQCEGVSQPSLAGYDPLLHRAILLDEPGPDSEAANPGAFLLGDDTDANEVRRRLVRDPSFDSEDDSRDPRDPILEVLHITIFPAPRAG